MTDIDCLLHTPITEAFGLVAIEAAAHGCPVVAAACRRLGRGRRRRRQRPHRSRRRCRCRATSSSAGGSKGLPQCVYDPAADALIEPSRRRSRALWPRTSPRVFDGRTRLRSAQRGARARTCSRSRASPPTFATCWPSSMAMPGARSSVRPRLRRMTVVLYRPSLDARSGAGQLLEMQWRGLNAAGVPAVIACERGALKFWLRTGVRARRRSVREIERLARAGCVDRRPRPVPAERRARLRAQSRDRGAAALAARRCARPPRSASASSFAR